MILNDAYKEGPLTSSFQIFVGNAICDESFDELKTPIIKLTHAGRKSIMLDTKIYDCILKKIEHFGSDEYIEDLGHSDLDGILQVYDEKLRIKYLSMLIVSVIALIAIVVIIVKMKKK